MQIAQNFGPTGQMANKQDVDLDYIADQLAIPAEIRTSPEERQQLQQMMIEQAPQMAQNQGMVQVKQAETVEVEMDGGEFFDKGGE